MKETILVPLDGSKVGETALPYVEELASKLTPGVKVRVILFQVVSALTHYIAVGEVSAQVPYTEQELGQFTKEAAAYLEEVGSALHGKGASVETRIAVGKAADEIIKAADELNVDLIAMSTHGRSGFSRWAFGSVTDRVLRGGNKPVLIVRAPKETEET